MNSNINPKTWNEFRDSGLLWFINSILHVFGWVIVVEVEDNEVKKVFPARTSFRGFSEDVQKRNHKKIAKYIKEHCNELYSEALED